MIDQYIKAEAQVARVEGQITYGAIVFIGLIVAWLLVVFVSDLLKLRKQQRRIRAIEEAEAERKEVDRMLARLEQTL